MKHLARNLLSAALATAAWALAATGAQAQTQGVTKDEIVLGSLQDFSGALTAISKEISSAMMMRVEEINAAGGIHGRKIKLVMEDSGYDPKKSILAAQKLIQQDKIFAMIGNAGTTPSVAAMSLLAERGMPDFMPLTASTLMYEPFKKNVFVFLASNIEQSRVGVRWMAKERAAKNFCVIYQDDDFGSEILKGAEVGIKELNQKLVEKASYKRGATEFTAQVARSKAAGCETVVLGTVVRETIGVMAEARKTGWNPQFITTANAYYPQVPKLGGAAVDNLYATYHIAQPTADAASPAVREWYAKYVSKYKDEPGLGAIYGYIVIDMFAQAAQRVGPNLTTEALTAAVESAPFKRDIFGSPEYKFSATNHLGNSKMRVTRINSGRWVPVAEYQDF